MIRDTGGKVYQLELGYGMQVTYCELWSDQLRSPTDEVGTEQARDAEAEPYCVVLVIPRLRMP